MDYFYLFFFFIGFLGDNLLVLGYWICIVKLYISYNVIYYISILENFVIIKINV